MATVLDAAKKQFNKLVMGTSIVAIGTGCGAGGAGVQMEVPSQLDSQFAKATPRPKMAKSLNEVAKGQPFPRMEDVEWGQNPFYKAEIARHDLMFFADVHAHLLRGKAANNTCEKDLMDQQLDILKTKLEATEDFAGESYPDFEPVAKAMERCMNITAAAQMEWLMARDEQRYREKESTYIRYMDFYRDNKGTPLEELHTVPLPGPNRYIASGPGAFSETGEGGTTAAVRSFRPSVGQPYPGTTGAANPFRNRAQSGVSDEGPVALAPLRGSGIAYEESVEAVQKYRTHKEDQKRATEEKEQAGADIAPQKTPQETSKEAPQAVRLENIPVLPSVSVPVTAVPAAPVVSAGTQQTQQENAEWFKKPSAYDYKTPAEYVRALHAYCQEAELKMVRGDADPTTGKTYQMNGQQKAVCDKRLRHYRK